MSESSSASRNPSKNSQGVSCQKYFQEQMQKNHVSEKYVLVATLG